mgnify:CR=1 FL=1
MRISSTYDCSEIGGWIRLRITWMLLLLAGLPLTSCSWKGLPNASSANASALYDPPTITLIEGQLYEFQEGTLVGRKDHKFHSDYSYRRAVIIGEK